MTIDRTFSIDLPEGMLTGSVTCDANEPTPNATAALGDALNMVLLVTCLRLNSRIKANESLVRSAAEAITEADTTDVSATFTSLLVQAHGANYQLQLTLSISTILSETELEELLTNLYTAPFESVVTNSVTPVTPNPLWIHLGFSGLSLWQTLLGFRPPGDVSLVRPKRAGRADLGGAGYGFLSDRRQYGDGTPERDDWRTEEFLAFGQRRIIADEAHHGTTDPMIFRVPRRLGPDNEPPRGGTELTIGDAVASGLIQPIRLPPDAMPGLPGLPDTATTGDDDPDTPDEPPRSPDPAA